MTQFDRRKSPRLRLKVPVLFQRRESEIPVWTETADISNNGFYCNTMQPFAPGDTLACLIVLPVQTSGSSDGSERLYLEAKIDVVRIIVNSASGFGVGFRIREYRVANSRALPSWAILEAENEPCEAAMEQPV